MIGEGPYCLRETIRIGQRLLWPSTKLDRVDIESLRELLRRYKDEFMPASTVPGFQRKSEERR